MHSFHSSIIAYSMLSKLYPERLLYHITSVWSLKMVGWERSVQPGWQPLDVKAITLFHCEVI